MIGATAFATYCTRKESAAAAAPLTGFRTVRDDAPGQDLHPIGNGWTQALFDGPFYVRDAGAPGLPAVSLVFVQSRDGDTVADDPSTLGGGETDKHLVYEGLSRVAADAVLAARPRRAARRRSSPCGIHSSWRCAASAASRVILRRLW